jgi:hypothetical protein
MVTIKRVDIVSAMKVGALLNALVVTVVSVLFFACNSLFFGSMAASISSLNAQAGGSPINTSSFAVASLTGCLVSYLILVVVTAHFPSRIPNWISPNVQTARTNSGFSTEPYSCNLEGLAGWNMVI